MSCQAHDGLGLQTRSAHCISCIVGSTELHRSDLQAAEAQTSAFEKQLKIQLSLLSSTACKQKLRMETEQDLPEMTISGLQTCSNVTDLP